MDFFGKVRGEGVENGEELGEFLQRHDLSLGEGIGADHHLRDRSVETEFFDVFTDFFDRLVDDPEKRFVSARDVLDFG